MTHATATEGQRHRHNGQPDPDVVNDLLAAAGDQGDGPEPVQRPQRQSVTMKPGNRIDYHPLTCAELIAAKFEIRYLVKGILAANQPLVIAAPQKAMKTSIMLDLAFSLAIGDHFLGYFKVTEPVAVCVMSGESGAATIAETLRRQARAAGHDPTGVRNLIVSERVPQLGSLEHLDAIEALIDEQALEVLIIDPVFLAMDGADAGNLFIQGQLLRHIAELCQKRGCTLILLHHTKKGTGITYQPLDLADISWSGFAEAARQWWLVSRRAPYIPGSGIHLLHFSVGGSAGHGGYWGIDIDEGEYRPGQDREWNVTIYTGAELRDATSGKKADEAVAKQQAKIDVDVKRILNALAKFPGGETKDVLRGRAGMSGSRANIAIAAALDEGLIAECDIVKANREKPYQGYKLAEQG